MGTAAFAVPVKPGKSDEWRAFCRAIGGQEADGFADMNRRYGLTRHSAWIQQTPMGDMVVVIQEGPGAEEFMGKVAASEYEFDAWFRERVTDIHPMDLDDPPEPPEVGIDWHA